MTTFQWGVPQCHCDMAFTSANLVEEVDTMAHKGFLSIHTVLELGESAVRMTSKQRRLSRNRSHSDYNGSKLTSWGRPTLSKRIIAAVGKDL